jgi:hypothetical protein
VEAFPFGDECACTASGDFVRQVVTTQVRLRI